jgi:hypothetical protein
MAIVNWDDAPEGAIALGKAGAGKSLVWVFKDGYQYVYKKHGKFLFSGGGVTFREHEIEIISERPTAQQWPEETRIDTIATNGNEGLHYATAKHDSDKPRYDLLPPVAIDLMAQVMTFGAKKYKPEGWRTVPDALQRYQAAMLRHAFSIQRGELIDAESGLPHAAHVMCCAAFITELQGEK